MSSGTAIFALFIRDIREMRLFQKLLADNEALLYNMLPVKIAHEIRVWINNFSFFQLVQGGQKNPDCRAV